MEQLRVNWNSSQWIGTAVSMTSTLWNFGAKRQGTHLISVIRRRVVYSLFRSVSSYCGKYPPLFGFISFHNGLIRCRSTINAYVITGNIIPPQKADTIILHFHVISTVSGSDCRCSRRHFKLRRTYSLNWTVDSVLCSRSRLRKLPFKTVE